MRYIMLNWLYDLFQILSHYAMLIPGYSYYSTFTPPVEVEVPNQGMQTFIRTEEATRLVARITKDVLTVDLSCTSQNRLTITNSLEEDATLMKISKLENAIATQLLLWEC